MKPKLYLECYAGISGDMTVAALLDLGASKENLQKVLASVPIKGYEIQITKVKKQGLEVNDFNVLLDKPLENHDHDMKYLHTHHEHHQETPHMHRHLKDIEEIIDQTKMKENAKKIAKKIFHILAEAEAKAHGISVQEVHFHEVGAIDSIIDIIAIAFCIDDLQITDVIVPSLYEGKGWVHCQHGKIPIPVPATLNIVSTYHIPMHLLEVEGELVTPTGAALVAALRTEEKLPPFYQVLKVGMGAGKREYETSGILRAMLITEVPKEK